MLTGIKEICSVNILSHQTSVFALILVLAIFFMIGMIWDQYFLSVKLIFFFPSKKVSSFFFSFIPLYSQPFSSHPDNGKAKYWVSKGSLFHTELWKVLSVAGMITVRLIIAWWPYCSVSKKKTNKYSSMGFPLYDPTQDTVVIDDCVSIAGIWLVKIYTLKWLDFSEVLARLMFFHFLACGPKLSLSFPFSICYGYMWQPT